MSTAATGRTRLRHTLVVTQVAISLSLLIVAGLFFQSLLQVTDVDPGFEPHGVVTVSFDTDLLGYTASRRGTFVTEFMRRVSSMPGVMSAAVSNVMPLGGDIYEATVAAEETATSVRAASASVSPGYFETMRVPLVRGREFSRADVSDAAPVAIVNETLARRLWPESDPIGKRIRPADPKEPWRDVIGVARDAKYAFLSEPPRDAYYVPLRLDAVSRYSVLVRSAGDSHTALSSLTNIAHDLDPNLPLVKLQTLDEHIHQSVNLQRAVAALLGVLGGLTVLLAAVGLYGVAAHSVSLRTREVGIRMSLGARAADVFRMIVRENLVLSLVGVTIGLGISAAASRILAAFLFGLTSTDPLTFIGGSMILCLVTIIASYIPARRAANLDPLTALRHE